jgi:hypothetical protein
MFSQSNLLNAVRGAEGQVGEVLHSHFSNKLFNTQKFGGSVAWGSFRAAVDSSHQEINQASVVSTSRSSH